HNLAVDLDRDAATVVAELVEQLRHRQRLGEGKEFAIDCNVQHGRISVVVDALPVAKCPSSLYSVQYTVASSRLRPRNLHHDHALRAQYENPDPGVPHQRRGLPPPGPRDREPHTPKHRRGAADRARPGHWFYPRRTVP